MKNKDKSEKKEDEKDFCVLEEWKRDWKKYEIMEYNEPLDFAKWFDAVYCDIKMKRGRSKKLNFFFKIVFIIVLAIPVAWLVDVSVCSWFSGTWKAGDFLSNITIVVPFCGIAFLVSKWNDVMKYQETWVRQNKTISMFDKEMVHFLMRTGDYRDSGFVKKFVENALAILEDDLERFSYNMNEKEIPLFKDIEKVLGK